MTRDTIDSLVCFWCDVMWSKWNPLWKSGNRTANNLIKTWIKWRLTSDHFEWFWNCNFVSIIDVDFMKCIFQDWESNFKWSEKEFKLFKTKPTGLSARFMLHSTEYHLVRSVVLCRFFNIIFSLYLVSSLWFLSKLRSCKSSAFNTLLEESWKFSREPASSLTKWCYTFTIIEYFSQLPDIEFSPRLNCAVSM